MARPARIVLDFPALIDALPPQRYDPQFFMFAVDGTFVEAVRPLDTATRIAKQHNAYIVTKCGMVLRDPHNRIDNG